MKHLLLLKVIRKGKLTLTQLFFVVGCILLPLKKIVFLRIVETKMDLSCQGQQIPFSDKEKCESDRKQKEKKNLKTNYLLGIDFIIAIVFLRQPTNPIR